MADLPIVQRVSRLRNLGVFRNYVHTSAVPDLKRHNLIYGFNGSGKTTLSRVFACLGAETLNSELPQGGEFDIELTDGSSVKTGQKVDSLRTRLAVFDVDFIEQNLRWKEGVANPVFYIGKEQAALAQKLEKNQAATEALEVKHTQAVKDHVRNEKTFAEHKRTTARLIAEELALGRKYDASNLVADYAKGPYPAKLRLPEGERQQLKSIILQDSPLAKCERIEKPKVSVAIVVRDAVRLLGTTIGAVALKDLQQHDGMLTWAKDGLDYHKAHRLASCLFCGNELSPDRLAKLSKVVDEGLSTLTDAIAAAQEQAEEVQTSLTEAKNSLPSANDISKEFHKRFRDAANDLRKTLARGIEIMEEVQAKLDKKASSPNVHVEPGTLLTEVASWDASLSKQVADFNLVIDDHNRSHDEFALRRQSARTALKQHYLADGQEKYTKLESDAKTSGQTVKRLEEQYQSASQENEKIKQEMRKHGPAAELINRMIRGYLGHKELEIATSESAYEIRRNGRPVTGSLSEGEKTAIALCYFLCTLAAEGRQLKNLIVVVDDPISSLDTKALHYAFSIIKGALEGAGQLIVMTHNLHFMNEAKKWLKKKAEEGKAALLYLNATQDVGSDTRSASIVEMPRLIRDYESEYQYLFQLVFQYAQSADGHSPYFYVMPNAMRKVLEIFLAFKLPGPEGLSNKVENLAGGGYGLDGASVRALDRLVQLESHADNLDDLVTFSSMTIEETKAAADALQGLMKGVDREHYDRLCRICR